jgi:5-methylcytosine-specific restriction endonuclease McrA
MEHAITSREEYDYALSRGYDALIDKRFPMPIDLRREIQKERFGKNNAAGNTKFYRYCLDNLPPVCEECGRGILYPSAINVSHILTRGAHPECAHDPRNVNILCLDCHARWENGDRRGMRIYERNQATIELLRKEYGK